MTLDERKILHALARLTDQYLEDGDGYIDHLCMSAGEAAVGVLFDFGLVSGSGRCAVWTTKGKKFLDDLHTQL